MSKSVTGLDKLLKKLEKLGGNVEETLNKSMQKQGEMVKGQAKMLAQVDSSDLRKSIRKKTKKSAGKIEIKIYTNSDHAAYVEFGTGKRGMNSHKPHNINVSYKEDWAGMIAQPYLYPALKNKEDVIIENIKTDIKKAIREVARG